MSDADFWALTSRVGKWGGLATKGRRKTAPRTPSLTHEEQLEILRLFPDGIGDRDRLPYSSEFEGLHRRFASLTGKRLTKHEFWRAVSRVAKLSRKPQPLFEAAPLGGLPRELVQYLERTNPWWRAQPMPPSERYRRWAFHEAMRRLEAEIAPAVAMRGPRRVGKSVIQEQIVEELLLIGRLGPDRIMRVQFDEIPALGAIGNPVEAIVRWYEDHVLREPINAVAQRGERVYLLFDELQNLPSWSGQLKALVDHVKARVLVTGSSALRIAHGKDSLAGRLSVIELGPLRLAEIAGIRGLGDLPRFHPESSFQDWVRRDFWLELVEHGRRHDTALRRAFDFYSGFGGYPICHKPLAPEARLLAPQLVEDVISKTIEHDPVRLGARGHLDRTVIRETFRLVCRYAGQTVQVREIARQISTVLGAGVRPDEVDEAIQFLVNTMLVHRIPPLEMLAKKQVSPARLCLCDHFLRNAWLQETVPLSPSELRSAPDAVATIAGQLMQSALGYFLRGLQGLEVSWFPSRHDEPEVDFILTMGLHRIPVEVKYQRGGITTQDLRGVRSFCQRPHYGADFGLVLTQDTTKSPDDLVIAVPASTFLLLR